MSGNLTWEKIKRLQRDFRAFMEEPKVATDLARGPSLTQLAAIRVITDPNLVERVPYPRSPARAKRRAKLGHPQHMRTVPAKTGYFIEVQNVFVVHPARYQDLIKAPRVIHRIVAPRPGGL